MGAVATGTPWFGRLADLAQICANLKVLFEAIEPGSRPGCSHSNAVSY